MAFFITGKTLKRRRSHTARQGFGLLETMIASAFTGVALAGAFSLANASRISGKHAEMRADFANLGGDIFEHIRSDRENTDDYEMNLGLTEAACEALAADTGTEPKQRRYEWCSILNTLSPYTGTETREIRVDAPEADKRVVTVVLTGGSQLSAVPVETVIKRMFEIPD